MKKSIKISLLTLLALGTLNHAKAQNLWDILNKENIQDAIENVAADFIDFSIVGAWSYQGSAVQLSSDSMLAEVGSTLTASTLESKIDGYLKQVGIEPGAVSFTFNADSTMVVKTARREVSGTYAYDQERTELTMTLSKVPITAKVEVLASSFSILFNVDKLLQFVQSISDKSSNAQIAAVSATLSAYDGMLVGFSFAK